MRADVTIPASTPVQVHLGAARDALSRMTRWLVSFLLRLMCNSLFTRSTLQESWRS